MTVWPWRQTCLQCHFFVKEARLPEIPGGVATFVVDAVERAKAARADYSWKADQYALACDFKVWDEGANFDAAQRHTLITQANRRGFCFFWRHHRGMLLPAARELQKRDEQIAKTRVDRRFSAYGLWLTALGLLLNVLARILENRHWPPFK
jgi:hypothetical protein